MRVKGAAAAALLAALLTAAILLGILAAAEKKENRAVTVTMELTDGEITESMLWRIRQFPGLTACHTALCADAALSVEGYGASVRLLGVDLESYPLTVTDSAGEKALGSAPLLIAGEEILSSLADDLGTAITERQQKVLRQRIGEVRAALTLGEDTADAEFLGICAGGGVYLDAESLQALCEKSGAACRRGRVCLTVRGESRARAAADSLTKAGFVEIS